MTILRDFVFSTVVGNILSTSHSKLLISKNLKMSDDFEGLCRLCLKPSKDKMVNISHFESLIGLIAKVKVMLEFSSTRSLRINFANFVWSISAGQASINSP